MNRRRTTDKKHHVHRKVGRRAWLVFLPHVSNDFHPHFIRWYGIVGMLIVSILAVISIHSPSTSVLGVEANISVVELLNVTNKERIKVGQQPLKYNEKLANAAYLKAQDMLKRHYWAHTSDDGITPWYWFSKEGYNYSYAGENLAKNFSTTSATVSAWMASKTHRDNVVNEHYQDVGFAVVNGIQDTKPITLVVAMYGSPATYVAGATSTHAAGETMGIVSRIGFTLQTMSPALLGSIALLVFGVFISLLAHVNRRHLPKQLRSNWKYHHGLFKAVGLTALVLVIVSLYSGGQI